MNIHPIEQESYEILRGRRPLGNLSPLVRAVTERAIHATADLDYADTLHAVEDELALAITALRNGCAVVTDVEMTRVGISSYGAQCYLTRGVSREGRTRSADAMAQAIDENRQGAIFVIGCAPTALFELVERYRAGEVAPALIIGMPVGFVGAAQSKEGLARCGAPAVYNRGEKGGSAAAAGVLNALIRIAKEPE
ncbi:MAG: precorrin-8X methylmutase [Actinomycetota bacterium]|nr:precorrin-8X methylmutase [Actinomycetota bacterium]